MAEDRRGVTIRLSTLQYGVIAIFTVLAVGFWVMQVVEHPRRARSYRPIMVVADATLAQVAAVRARRLDCELPDIVGEQVPTRQYPEAMAAHLFGYVGEVNDAQVGDSDGLKSGDIV